jgi:hypothetical protein
MAATYQGDLGCLMSRREQFGGCAWKEDGGVARICIKWRMLVIAHQTMFTTGLRPVCWT